MAGRKACELLLLCLQLELLARAEPFPARGDGGLLGRGCASPTGSRHLPPLFSGFFSLLEPQHGPVPPPQHSPVASLHPDSTEQVGTGAC